MDNRPLEIEINMKIPVSAFVFPAYFEYDGRFSFNYVCEEIGTTGTTQCGIAPLEPYEEPTEPNEEPTADDPADNSTGLQGIGIYYDTILGGFGPDADQVRVDSCPNKEPQH